MYPYLTRTNCRSGWRSRFATFIFAWGPHTYIYYSCYAMDLWVRKLPFIATLKRFATGMAQLHFSAVLFSLQNPSWSVAQIIFSSKSRIVSYYFLWFSLSFCSTIICNHTLYHEEVMAWNVALHCTSSFPHSLTDSIQFQETFLNENITTPIVCACS